jgi:hypothetical protein
MSNLKNKKSFASLVRRYHLVSFIVIVVLSLSVAIILLYRVVEKAGGTDSIAPGAAAAGFDQSTIDRIERLKTPADASIPLDLSKGRISPFNE